MKCRQPGCTGTIVDGYCDVCGMPGPNGPVTSVTMSSAPAGVQGGACQQPGCTGHYVDGYCDVCGTPAAAPSAPLASHGTAAASTSTAIGAMAIGSARAVSFGDKVMPKRPSGQRSRVARIGAGITVVPPAPAIDPEKALMVDPQVPMDQRFCSNCGAKVGRTDTSGGREEGFCPQCGHPYSFTPKLKAGDVVAGQYEVAGSLAHGGMGWIYLARDRNLSNRWVVLKGLLNSDDADTAKAAIAEQQWLASLENPLIVEIYNFVTFEGSRYIVMEYVGGRSLKELLKQRLAANSGRPDPLPVDQALAFLIEILPAFSYLHDQGLVYCDFKPDQVMQVGDALKLIDLGGVRRITDDESALYGTIGYQAPEVAKAGASIASDIFTIGRTLMVLCADVPGYQTSYQYTTPPAEEMPAFAAHDSLYRLLLKACATDPADRFTSAEELRVQMLGILREVVGVGSGRTASTSAASALFEPPTLSGDRVDWRQLPTLRPDPTDRATEWLHSLRVSDPVERLAQLDRVPSPTTEVQLARARAALEAGQTQVLNTIVHDLLLADPWEWRAVWMAGLGALVSADFATAQASFNAVYGQAPGELAPKLALALSCEQGGQPAVAENLYLICAATDANYVTPAAFGLARIRLQRGSIDGVITALDLVPSTSGGYPEAQQLKVQYLIDQGTTPEELGKALQVIGNARLDPASQAGFEASIYEKLLNNGRPGLLTLNGASLTTAGLKDRLSTSYRTLARTAQDEATRTAYLDKANRIRPWSFL